MEMVRGLDAGPMVARVKEPISDFDTTGSLEERLSRAGARLLIDVIEDWAAGRIRAEAQDEALVTYAPQLSREDARLDWSLSAVDLWRRVRAFQPWPVAHTEWRGQELRIHEAWPLEGVSSERPGTVIGLAPLPEAANSVAEALAVQTGDGALALLRVQRAGAKAMSGLEFLRGQRDLVGARLA
jgi:methionyl-tRNA formyltransferase